VATANRGDVLAALAARWHLRGIDQLGDRVRLRGRPVVTARGRISIGDRVQLVSTLAPLELIAEEGATLEIGARTLVNFGCSLVAVERVSVGERCLIGPHCIIQDTAFHRVEPERRLEHPKPLPVTIGDNVWLGARVIVMPGVSIGADSAVGAGSVVTHDVPARMLAAGVPARVIREL
jgi:maltose O-acetyltransferase